MIIVVTHSQDLTADFAIRHLVENKVEFLRLDIDTLSTPERHFGFESGRPTLKYDAVTVLSDDVTAIWARRFARPQSLTKIVPSHVQFAQREIRDAMEAFIDSAPGLVVNSYEADRRAANRLGQSIAATNVGFAVPATLVTQDKQKAVRFAAERKIVAKAISFGIMTEDGERVTHTTRVSPSQIEGLEFCPALFQEEIVKCREWRVTTVGNKIFSARTRDDVEIDKSDWRRSPNVKDIFEASALPSDVGTQLLALCSNNGIHFGAHDLIEADDGKFVFLETNPAGQWAWLELTLGLPIGRAVADLLMEREARS